MRSDAEWIEQLVPEINRYLEAQPHVPSVWEQIDAHLRLAYIAECLGDLAVIAKQLAAAKRLLTAAHTLS